MAPGNQLLFLFAPRAIDGQQLEYVLGEVTQRHTFYYQNDLWSTSPRSSKRWRASIETVTTSMSDYDRVKDLTFDDFAAGLRARADPPREGRFSGRVSRWTRRRHLCGYLRKLPVLEEPGRTVLESVPAAAGCQSC